MCYSNQKVLRGGVFRKHIRALSKKYGRSYVFPKNLAPLSTKSIFVHLHRHNNHKMEAAIQSLDFERIAQHMIDTNWAWWVKTTSTYRVPTVDEIERFVRGRFVVYDRLDGREYRISLGGFTFVRADDTYEVTFDFRGPTSNPVPPDVITG